MGLPSSMKQFLTKNHLYEKEHGKCRSNHPYCNRTNFCYAVLYRNSDRSDWYSTYHTLCCVFSNQLVKLLPYLCDLWYEFMPSQKVYVDLVA